MRIFGLILFRGRWLVVLLAFGVAVIAASYGMGVFEHLDSSDAQVIGSQSTDVQSLLNTRLSGDRAELIMLFQNPVLQVTDPPYQNAMLTVLSTLSQRGDIAAIATYNSTGDSSFLSRDGHETFATIAFANGTDRANSYAWIRSSVHSSVLQITYGGPVVAAQEFGVQIRDDLKHIAIIALPLVALALLFLLDGVLAALLPLLLGGITIACSLAELRLLSSRYPINVFAITIAALVGVTLTLAFASLIIARFREELRVHDGNVLEALQRTFATAGRTVCFAGVAVIISLSGLLPFSLDNLRSLGVGLICAASIAMLVSLTLLPALLAIGGNKVGALSLRRLYGLHPSARGFDQTTQADALPRVPVSFPMRFRFLLTIGLLLGFFALGARLTPLDAQQLLVVLAIAAGIITACKSLPAAIIATGSAVFFWYLLRNLTDWNVERVSIFALVELGAAIDFTLMLDYAFRIFAVGRRFDVLGAVDAAIRVGVRTIGLSMWVSYTLLIVLAFLVIPSGWKPFLYAICGAFLLSTYTALVPLPLALACSRPGAAQRRWLVDGVLEEDDALAADVDSHEPWYRLTQTVTHFAIPAALLALMAMLTLGLPMFQVRFAQSAVPTLPHSQSARVVNDRLLADFSLAGMPQNEIVVTVRGNTAEQIDAFAAIRTHLLETMSGILVATFLLLVFMTGSVVVPLSALICNCLTLFASYGILTFIFQQGHGQRLLGLQAPGSLDPAQIIVVSTVAFGLSMMFTIFLLSRIKEQYDWTGDHRQAVAIGVLRSGQILTAIALLLAVMLIPALSSQFVLVKLVSLGSAIAILIDATIVRVLLAPALLRILGEWSWWPGSNPREESQDYAWASATIANRNSPDATS